MTSTKSIPTRPRPTCVLGFDPGFERLGAAVVKRNGSRESLTHSECIRTKAALPFPERLRLLGEAAHALIKEYKPDCVAIEKLYFEKNVKTAIQVAEVAGMLTYIAAEAGLPLHEYTPLEVKVAITGYGKSEKAAVAQMVSRLVSVPERKRLDDEMDAIAIALTCLASAR